ncbi:hypothetical protein ACOJBM_16220 [Rhizobium beringeri]|jgi:hypothetical protein|uniref:Integral membrane protein n=2 Tax=Rhizobium TaxID=379 RepID=A0A444I4Z7_RHILE|nr:MULTISPECIES: hypothetical protein [Rhizobium]MBY5457234.1 hypothetical protein [Rhizobium leguminosarum]NKL64055.1 hypothetical protein [Rhizobium leguminosarum bv. viciae]RWX12930.1 hypothetical protein EHI45_16670 [Rhizobium leguminosarum]RWX33028.1 hypothetical protein EHI47_09770 [Rhizobium leguminosarum]TAU52812.1 hypothetical protein ELI43_08325 [Rhizobium leguminosarum]
MKVSFVVVLSAAALLSGISAEAQVDSGGFDARGICRRPEGCVVDHGQGGSYNGPRNYRNFNGRNERDGRNDRERDNRRYRSQNRSDNFDAGTSRLVAGLEIGLQIRV